MKIKLFTVIALFYIVVALFAESAQSFAVERRSVAPERSTDDYPDYLSGVKYDEYPMIVPKKRAALLIDRLMGALQKAIENGDNNRNINNYSNRPEDAVRTMDLQRRGHGSLGGQQKGRVYWRCYFNAVTCF